MHVHTFLCVQVQALNSQHEKARSQWVTLTNARVDGKRTREPAVDKDARGRTHIRGFEPVASSRTKVERSEYLVEVVVRDAVVRVFEVEDSDERVSRLSLACHQAVDPAQLAPVLANVGSF